MSDEIKALVEGVIDLFPSADRQAMTCLAELMNKTLTAQADEIERLRVALIEEREENLWDAYHSGHAKDGQWTHMFMSTGEWLARECGLDPSQGHYDDAEIRAAIPRAALKAAQEVKS